MFDVDRRVKWRKEQIKASGDKEVIEKAGSQFFALFESVEDEKYKYKRN